MTKEETIKYMLMDEIHRECEDKGVTYYLLDQEILCYERGINVYSCEADICMRLSDYKKIHRNLKKKKLRVVETIYNNHSVPCCYCRYVYTKTLAYRPEYHNVRKAMGISVNIHFIRDISKNSEMLSRFELGMCERIEGNEIGTGNLDVISFKLPKTFLFAACLSALLRKATLKDFKGRSSLFIPERGRIIFPESFFFEKQLINISGHNYYTVQRVDDYLRLRYGDNYKELCVVNMMNHYMVIVDNGIKYNRIVPILNRDRIFSKEFWVRRNRFLKKYTEHYCKMEEKEKEIYSYFYCEEARFRLWKQYYWQRDELLSLYSQERFDELWMRFRNFNVEVMRGLKQGYVPVFDDELYELYRKLCNDYLSSELHERIDKVLLDRPIPELDGGRIGKYYTAEMCHSTYKTRRI